MAAKTTAPQGAYDRDVLIIRVPQTVPLAIQTTIRLQPEDARILADLQTRTGLSCGELAGMLIRWAAERVVIENT